MSSVKVSQRVVDNEYFLKAVMHAKSVKQRRLLLRYAVREEILALSEVVANYLVGVIQIDNDEHFGLYVRHKRLFRVLGFKGRKSWKKRQQAAIDLGKVLMVFLKDVMPLLWI